MSLEPVLANVEDSIDKTLFAFRQQGVRRLPIVDEQGRMAGLVSLDEMWVLLSANEPPATLHVIPLQGFQTRMAGGA